MNGHEQRQIDELKSDVRHLDKKVSDFIGEARERGAEIVGLINTRVAERMGEHDTLKVEMAALKAATDDSHQVAMRRIDALKANSRWWAGTTIGAAIAALVAMLGGWAENWFGN